MRWITCLSVVAVALAVCTGARGDTAKINTQVVSADLAGTWEAQPEKEGGFKEELHLGPALTGEWHRSARTLPVTIAWFVEGNDLRILHYEPAGDAFNDRVKTMIVPYKLSADRLTLALTLDGKPTTWTRGKPVEAAKPPTTAAAAAAPPVGNAPPKTYRLVAQVMDGSEPSQWVLAIVTPEGYAWVTTPAALHACIGRRVPEGATLEWVPQDTVRGGEPLRSEREVDALRALCKERKIQFVRVPAG